MLRTAVFMWMFLLCGASLFAQSLSLNGVVVLVRPGSLPNAERTAATVLREELEKRSGIRIKTTTHWPQGKPVIATWENPGQGSFYDDVGNVAKSPHVVRIEIHGPGLDLERGHGPTFWWWDEGMSRKRLSWQVTKWPRRMVYDRLDPKGTYVVRSTGYKQALVRVNGERIQPTVDGQEIGEFKEFPIPQELLKDRRLILTWDPPVGEEGLNWRDRSRLAEVWLIKKTTELCITH